MNECFVYGKVIEEPELSFLYRSDYSSIGYFFIKLTNNSIIKVLGYDDIADYIYRSIKKGDVLNIECELRNKKNTI